MKKNRSLTVVQATDFPALFFDAGFGLSEFSITSTGAPVVINVGEQVGSPAASTEVFFNGFEIVPPLPPAGTVSMFK